MIYVCETQIVGPIARGSLRHGPRIPSESSDISQRRRRRNVAVSGQTIISYHNDQPAYNRRYVTDDYSTFLIWNGDSFTEVLSLITRESCYTDLLVLIDVVIAIPACTK